MHSPLHVSIGVLDGSGINLKTDLSLIKAALLYADQVSLISLHSYIVVESMRVRDLDHDKWVAHVMGLIGKLEYNDDPGRRLFKVQFKRYVALRQKGDLTLDEGLEMSALKVWFDGWVYSIASQIQEDYRVSGGGELLKALESGLVNLYEFQNGYIQSLPILPHRINLDLFSEREQTALRRSSAREFIDVVEGYITSSDTLPLFNDHLAKAVNEIIRQGGLKVSDMKAGRAKPVALATKMFKDLPLFENATIDQILDIRKELEPHLAPFHSGMQLFAQEIKSAAWDEDFPIEAGLVFDTKVSPAMRDITSAIQDNKPLRNLMMELATKEVAAGGMLAFGLSQTGVVADALSKAVLAAGSTVGVAAYNAKIEADKKQREVEGNSVYLYYRLRDRLTGKQKPKRKGLRRRR